MDWWIERLFGQRFIVKVIPENPNPEDGQAKSIAAVEG
jgi:hypothetical protein